MTELPSYPGAPRWVKVLGTVAVILLVVLVALLATGGPGGHGPGRHAPPAVEHPPQP